LPRIVERLSQNRTQIFVRFHPLAGDFRLEILKARDIAASPDNAADKTCTDRVFVQTSDSAS
jgi:hypothetical protein